MFKFKQKITCKTENNGTKDVQLMVTLKYLSNFWRTLEMLLFNCEFNLLLSCFIMAGATEFEELTFTITYRKLYVPNVTLSALLLQLKTGFKRTIK